EILPRYLERCLHRLGAAGNEIHVCEPRGRVRRELVGERLGDLGGEKAGVRVFEPVELRAHRRKHVRVPVPETGDSRAAARVEVAPPFGVDQVHALAAGRDRIGVAQIAVHDMSHCGLLLGPPDAAYAPSSRSSRSDLAIAASARCPPCAAISAASTSAAANAAVMAWKKDGLSVEMTMLCFALRASGESALSVSATTATPRPAAYFA